MPQTYLKKESYDELVQRHLDASQFVNDATEAALKELKKKAGPA